MTATTTERAAIDRALLGAFARHAASLGPVAAPVRHAIEGGGKRLRGLLTMAAYDAAGGTGDASPLAAELEIVHAYSLVHDDLPCMDDDVMRRGRPTVHVVYGVDSATVAGVAMVPFAMAAALDACRSLGLDSAATRAITARLMRASGAGGMVGGQLLDLLGEGRVSTLEELETIHLGKTASLIAAATAIGGLAAGASKARVTALDEYGESLGLAFQIMDDLLDVTGTTEALGKTAGRDTELQKSTYPSLMGLDGARAMAKRKVDEALGGLSRAGLLTDTLRGFAHFVVERAS